MNAVTRLGLAMSFVTSVSLSHRKSEAARCSRRLYLPRLEKVTLFFASAVMSFFVVVVFTNKSQKSYIHLARLTLCYTSGSYATGRFFYRRPEHRNCHRISLRMQALYAIKLPCLVWRKKKTYEYIKRSQCSFQDTENFLVVRYMFEPETETEL